MQLSTVCFVCCVLCWRMQVHAEQFLMANLVLHNERGLHTLAISAAPCGHCRQFYSELGCAVGAALPCAFMRCFMLWSIAGSQRWRVQ
jgi:cytidine deaminase